MVKNVSDILEAIKIVYGDFDPAFADNIDHDQSVFIPYFPGIRAKLDINEHLQGKNIFQIDFWFQNFDNLSVELQIDDKTWDTHRPLYMNKIRQKGSSLKFEKNEGLFKDYFFSISQEIFSEDDESKGCKNYPNEIFKTYNECDEAFVQSATNQRIQTYCPDVSDKGMFPATFIPIFATHNLSLVTRLQVIANCSHKSGLYEQMSGAKASSCPLPCTTTTTNTILANSVSGIGTGFTLYFDKSIMVTNVTVDKFQPMVSLNFLGSNLGLWPGLGIFQLFEWFFDNILSRININGFFRQMIAKMTERILNKRN